jgi:hypothetical protein
MSASGWQRARLRRSSLVGALVIATLLSSLLSGCLENVSNAANNAVLALDNGVTALGSASVSWQAVVQDTTAKVNDALKNATENVRSTISNELSNTVARATQATGIEARCSLDFVKFRVRDALIRIRVELLSLVGSHQTVPERAPMACMPNPTAIDPVQVQANHVTHVDFDGYDFDSVPPVTLKLETSNGQVVDVPQNALVRTSHYLITLNLGSNGLALSSQSQAVHLRWKDEDISTVAVVQPHTPLCVTTTALSVPQPTTLRPPHLGSGDHEFGRPDHGPVATFNASLFTRPEGITAYVHLTLTEDGPDYTMASGGASLKYLYSPPAMQKIQSMTIGTTNVDINRYRLTKADDRFSDDYSVGGDSPIRQVSFIGYRGANAAGETARAVIYWNPLRLILVGPPSGESTCVSASALRTAEASHAISLQTLAGVDGLPRK